MRFSINGAFATSRRLLRRRKRCSGHRASRAISSPWGTFPWAAEWWALPTFAQAETALREALELQPENRRARFLLGKTLVLSGKHAEGEALLDSLLVEEESAEAHSLRGLARMRRRDFAGAGQDFHRASVLDPSDAMAWFNGSLALERQGKSAEAAAARVEFEQAQQLEEALHQMEVSYHSNTENLDAGLELATLLRRAGKTHPARILLETLAADRPDDPRASIFLSEIAADAGALEAAQESARRALEIAPDHPRALVALSNALATVDAPQALALARRAVEMAPQAAPAHVALARRLLDSGDAGAALKEFQVARQLAPQTRAFWEAPVLQWCARRPGRMASLCFPRRSPKRGRVPNGCFIAVSRAKE